MVNIFNYVDNFIFVISQNRKIKFVNKAILKKIELNLKDVVDIPVKECLYSNNKSLNNLIDSLGKDETINCDFCLDINEKKYFFNGDLLEGDFYREKSYFLIARDICEKFYKREDLEELLDTLDISCFIKNKKGEYLYTNKKKQDFHKCEKTDLIGSKSNIFFDEEDATYIKHMEDIAIKRRESVRIEREISILGEKNLFEITINPILNKSGSLKYLAGNSKNIDLKRYTDKTLDFFKIRLQEINETVDKDVKAEKIKKLLDYISDKTMSQFNADGITLIFFDKNEKTFDTLMKKGLVISDLTNYERKEIYNNIYDKYSKNIESEGIKYVNEIKNNDIIVRKLKEKNICKIGIYNISFGNSLLGQIIITFLDDKKNIEYGVNLVKTICFHLYVIIFNLSEFNNILEEIKTYRDKKKYLEKCIDISVDIIGRFDKNGNIVSINEDRLKSILGWDINETNECNIFNIMSQEDIDYVKEQIKNTKDSTIHRESKIICKNGKYKWLEWNLKLDKNEDTFFFTAREITQKKLYEKNKLLLEEAVQLEALKNRFFRNISHEFKTPLNIILGTVQLIEKYEKNNNYTLENLDYHLKFIKSNSYRLLRLVQNLLDLSKIQSENYGVCFGNYDIISIVEDISMSVANYLESKNINLIFDTNCEEQIISCDPEKIERIVLNLLSNAIKYNKDNNDINVDIKVEDGFVNIAVKDRGIGIEEEQQKLIFDEFQKINDGLTRSCEGIGLGLPIVNEFVCLHKGTISVKSEIEKGSTFEVKLPIIINDIEENEKTNRYLISQNKVETCNIEFSDIYN